LGEIRLVGTAHVSQASVDEVRQAIEEYQPDVVAIELDKARFAAIMNQGEKPSVNEILKGGNFSELLVQWSLAYIQRKIGMDVGVEPGAEMLAAIEEAEKHEIPIALADRDIRLTLSRFWKGMGIIEKFRLLFAVAGAVAGGGDEEEIDIEELTKNQDLIEASIEEFRKFSPKGADALIGERDAYLTHSLLRLAVNNEKVLGVVGAGHVKGIREYMSKPDTLPPFSSLLEQPKGFPWKLAFGVFFVALFAFLILLIAFSGVGFGILLEAILYWIVINGVLAAGFTLVAGGHPLSALTAFGVSWLTSLNPFLAAGWFAAITEAKIRKPQASDFQEILDAASFSEMRKVPIFRVVLVAALANVGSTIGTFAYFIFIFPILGIDPKVILADGFSNLVTAIAGILPF